MVEKKLTYFYQYFERKSQGMTGINGLQSTNWWAHKIVPQNSRLWIIYEKCTNIVIKNHSSHIWKVHSFRHHGECGIPSNVNFLLIKINRLWKNSNWIASMLLIWKICIEWSKNICTFISYYTILFYLCFMGCNFLPGRKK